MFETVRKSAGREFYAAAWTGKREGDLCEFSTQSRCDVACRISVSERRSKRVTLAMVAA